MTEGNSGGVSLTAPTRGLLCRNGRPQKSCLHFCSRGSPDVSRCWDFSGLSSCSALPPILQKGWRHPVSSPPSDLHMFSKELTFFAFSFEIFSSALLLISLSSSFWTSGFTKERLPVSTVGVWRFPERGVWWVIGQVLLLGLEVC